MKAAHVGEVGSVVRQARFESAKVVVDVANARQVDLMIVAGDVFEDNAVGRVDVQRIGDILSNFHGPVYLIPGNHDPLVPGSVWEHAVWNQHANLTLLDRPRAIETEKAWLFPCPLTQKNSPDDPTAWIDASNQDKVAIGIAHGTVDRVEQSIPDYPISCDAASRCGLDYLALGHWHSFSSYPDVSGLVRMAYSGTHETTKFGERNSGNVLVVEIASRAAAPKIEAVPTGVLKWHTRNIDCTNDDNVVSLIAEIEKLDAADRTLMEIGLEGVSSSTSAVRLKECEDTLSARFLYHRMDDSRLLPEPNPDWIEDLPDGLVRQTARSLQQKALIEESKAVASQSLLELYRLNSEG